MGRRTEGCTTVEGDWVSDFSRCLEVGLPEPVVIPR
jgi:hypothetical protein